jgi:hypothetical protein
LSYSQRCSSVKNPNRHKELPVLRTGFQRVANVVTSAALAKTWLCWVFFRLLRNTDVSMLPAIRAYEDLFAESNGCAFTDKHLPVSVQP